MAKSYAKSKGRAAVSWRITFPNRCLVHPNFKSLSGLACKMLFELGSQFKAYNNGDLQATWKLLKPNGWVSKQSIQNSIEELERAGWIVRTRQGGRNRCSLYAITFQPVYGNSKLDAPWSVRGKQYPAPNDWQKVPNEN